MFRWLLLSLLIFPWWALAQTNADCSSVDLTTSAESPMAVIPRWNQGISNVCYAYSAATLIDEYRLSRGDRDKNFLSSPMLLALKTMAGYESEGSTLKGGKIEHAFYTAKSFGTCSSFKLSDHLGSEGTESILKNFARIYKLAQVASKKEAVREVIKFLSKAGVKADELPASEDVEKNLALSEVQFLAKTLLPFCEETKALHQMPNVKLLFQPEVSSDEVVQQVQNLLKSNIPVGINFCSNVATDPQHKGQLQNGKWHCDKNKNHSALIAGRKLVVGKCQFLVRDTGCEGYEKASPGRCYQGQYWVDAESLTQNLHGIFWLE